MQVSMIGCPFRTSYGAYIESLKNALERTTDASVRWIGSNCGCGDPVERARLFQSDDCSYFEMPQVSAFRSDAAWKRTLRFGLRNSLYYFRAARYDDLSTDADVAHLQQILNATGSDVAFHWLRRPSAAARVITIHELDGEQTEFPERNRTYNLADAIVVHDQQLRGKLIALGVRDELIHVVRYGTEAAEAPPASRREGLVFYGGHKPMTGKGLDTVLAALALVAGRLGDATPRLRIHGHYGTTTPPEALALARAAGVADRVEWLNQIAMDEMRRLYRGSLACLLPYTGSFAGLPVGVAAANELPVVCTRKAGIPDHLGGNGIFVGENRPGELADRIVELTQNEALRAEHGIRLRRWAEKWLAWDVIARETFAIYRAAWERAARARHALRQDAISAP